MIICFGDLHLNDERPWSEAVAKEIIYFIDTLSFNNNQHTAVFLGDITEKAILTGNTNVLLLSLLRVLRFKKTYFLLGNHDIKIRKQKPTIPLQFLNDPEIREHYFNKFVLITSPSIVQEDGMKLLFLPTPFKVSVEDFFGKTYSDRIKHQFSHEVFDIVFGHFADTSSPIFLSGEIVDISYLQTQYICLGHVHLPTKPNYIGSLVPNALSEAGQPRNIWIFEKTPQGIQKTIYPISPPIFDFYTIKYPQPFFIPPARVAAWIVENCQSEEIIRRTYGNIYIHSYKRNIEVNFNFFKQYTSSEEKLISFPKLFDEWKKISSTGYPDSLLNKAKEYLAASFRTN